MKNNQLIINCPIGCQSTLYETNIVLPTGNLLKCSNCGHIVSSCTHDDYEQSLQKWNSSEGTFPGKKDYDRYQQVITKRLLHAKKLIQQKNLPKLLDVGCSSGALLSIAKNCGFEVFGVEPASDPAKTSQSKGFNVFHGFLREAHYPDYSFDVIVLFEIIEHVITPLQLIKECERILSPGGIILINTPNASSYTARFMKGRWEGFDLYKMGGHVSFFTPGSLSVMANKSGLKIKRIETRNIRFYENGQVTKLFYKSAKIMAQLLAYPVKMINQGHDLLCYLSKN
ncbi:MAG: class I SAM-dependent methyltransferase [Pseudomonadota bacterium]|nr:class I SAM-dependent methyltransferase [Pseudomonadota bacterium]